MFMVSYDYVTIAFTKIVCEKPSTTNQWSRWPQRTAYRHWYNQKWI